MVEEFIDIDIMLFLFRFRLDTARFTIIFYNLQYLNECMGLIYISAQNSFSSTYSEGQTLFLTERHLALFIARI